jgi:hypothetical protein
MKALGFGLVFGGVVFVSACSSATPASDCNHLAQVSCQRYFTCDATAAAKLYVTETNCETQFESTYNCASLVCPANTTYHDDKVNTCLSAVNAQTCADTSTPPSCSGFSTSVVCY